MTNSVHGATGDRLRRIRMDAGLSIKAAVESANQLAAEANHPTHISIRALMRFERIGTAAAGKYGATPPTLAELNLLLQIYNGSPIYLLFGALPTRYPIAEIATLKGSFYTEQVISIINTVTRWPAPRQQKFAAFLSEFIS